MKETADFKVYTKGAGSGELKVTVKGPSESGGDPFFLGGGGGWGEGFGTCSRGAGCAPLWLGYLDAARAPLLKGILGSLGECGDAVGFWGGIWGFGGPPGFGGDPLTCAPQRARRR